MHMKANFRVRKAYLIIYGGDNMPWTTVKEEDKRVYEYGDSQGKGRKIGYIESINETLRQAMLRDKRVFLMGQGINDAVGMFGMTNGLMEEFGEDRAFDTPIAETGLAGIAVGAAMSGRHPIYFHNRPDFLMLAMDQLVNHASKYAYMSAGQYSVPLLICAVTGKGWGSAAQHSQALQGLFMHIPGLKIMMPTTPYDVKGLLGSAIEEQNPVMFLDHRRIHNQEGAVLEELYKIPFGKGVIRKSGKDVTIVGISSMLIEVLDAASQLEKEGISAEVIDLRTIKPWDIDLVTKSVCKTGRLLVADTGWGCCGVASEIAVVIYENCFKSLKATVERVVLPDVPTPAAYNLENVFYQNSEDIYKRVKKIIN